MKQGTLVLDIDSGRMDIRFGLNDFYGGLHCGTIMEVLIDGKWVPTRIEMSDDWFMVGVNTEQQKRVTDNMGLVAKVIREKVSPPYQVGMYTYDDLHQIGCIGLCKAVATDKGGTFSTNAHRLIWNEIFDALIYATRRQSREILIEDDAMLADSYTHFDYEEKKGRVL